ncbi:MAG: hypothetical protein M0R70_12465 [Nitrospirae bacterium]|nr:hypothetical protein [Nitrospirota bacterium]
MYQIWIAVIASLIMAGGLGGIYYLIIKQNAVIGSKTIQFISIVFVLPLMLALGVLNIISRDTIGPLIGVIIGFTLGGSWKD